jgi:hypothetical protein
MECSFAKSEMKEERYFIALHHLVLEKRGFYFYWSGMNEE